LHPDCSSIPKTETPSAAQVSTGFVTGAFPFQAHEGYFNNTRVRVFETFFEFFGKCIFSRFSNLAAIPVPCGFTTLLGACNCSKQKES